MPSADVTPEKKLFLEAEAQVRPWENQPFFLGTGYTAVGVGRNTELDLTVFNAASPKFTGVSLGLGFKPYIQLFREKWRDRELKIVFGDLIPVSLEGQEVGNTACIEFSGRLPKPGTRLTAVGFCL